MIQIIFSALIATSSSASPAAPRCAVSPVVDRTFSVEQNARVIAISGWAHPDWSAWTLATLTLTEIENEVQWSGCDSINRALHHLTSREKFQSQLPWSEHLAQVMNEFKKLGPFTLALEQTDPGLSRNVRWWRNTRERISRLSRICKRPDLDVILTIALGPELNWASQNQIPVFAAEDKAIRQRSIHAVNASGMGFDFSKLSPLALEAVSGLPPFSTPAQREKVVEAETNPELRPYLRQALLANSTIYAGIHERDRAIVRRLLRARGNVLLPIGYAHVDDLHRKMTKYCQPRTHRLERINRPLREWHDRVRSIQPLVL